VSLPSSDRAPGAIPRARCWERVGSVAPNSWYLNLVPRDSAACAHSGRHYGERTRAVPVARTRAQVPVNLSGTQARTLPALALGDQTAVLPLRQGHSRIRTHGNSQKETRLCKKRKRVRARKVPKQALHLLSQVSNGSQGNVREEDSSGQKLRGAHRTVRAGYRREGRGLTLAPFLPPLVRTAFSLFCEVKSHWGILAIPKKVDGQHLSEKVSHVRTHMNDLWKCIERDHLPGPSRYG